ncbi:tail fiber domain-containing protein [uncultured Bacteroides sp.]|uniref:tail fiber domain-containing protein n=1 Tax=uncultured Bacteroides sp. TaxID=162156 RepID=UPI002614F2DD|nr:tail fiber domain-containing protein [uncultured Bacteroides sp.]
MKIISQSIPHTYRNKRLKVRSYSFNTPSFTGGTHSHGNLSILDIISSDDVTWLQAIKAKISIDGTNIKVDTNLYTTGGITMFGNDGEVDIPTIFDSLPIDGTTIYWDNGILKSAGSSSAITEITSEMVVSALGYTPFNSDNLTKANIKFILGIADWALAAIKPSYNYTEITDTPDLSIYALAKDIPSLTGYATTASVNTSLAGKVDKVTGKQLSTEDFTTALKTKLEGLSNYNDSTISSAINKLREDFDTLVSGDTTTAIKSFNDIVAFLDGITDTEDLESIIASIETQIATKQDIISDLATIRAGAKNGATALQSYTEKYTGTVTSVATGAGLTGGAITSSGTLKCALKSETKSTLEATSMGSTSGRQYAVGLDKNGILSVNVPWTDNNTIYTHPTTSGNKHIPSGGSSGQILRWGADGTAVWGNDNNTTYSAATINAAGLMSADDKKKLDGIASGANNYTLTKSAIEGLLTGNITTHTHSQYLTGITSALVTTALGYTPYNSANFTKANIKSTLAISDWALAANKPSYSFSEITSKPTTLAGYGITDAALTSSLSNYLPLSGGTMNNNAGIYFNNNVTAWDSANGLQGISNLSSDSALGYWAGISFKGYYGIQLRSYGGTTTKLQYRGNNSTAWGAWYDIWHSGNLTDNKQLLNGAGYITGITSTMVTNALGYTPYNSASFTKANIRSTLGISDWALAASKPTYTYSEVGAAAASHGTHLSGNAALTSSSNSAVNANDVTYNIIGYYTSNGPATTLGASTNDGALYSQAYNASWIAQIAQDYRNGNLFIRGKNNGTWQSWKRVACSGEAQPASDVYAWAKAATKPSYAFSEITSKPTTISGYGITDAPTKTGTGASGTWGISVTGSSASCTGNAASATKLQTARTIWGQSFNGTGNVDGDMTVTGNILTTGGVTMYSDRRLKTDIQPLNNRGYITPCSYVKDGKKEIGFIAQDVQEIYPELVKEGEYLSLNYSQMTAILEAQIIELRNEINELKEELKKYGS